MKLCLPCLTSIHPVNATHSLEGMDFQLTMYHSCVRNVKYLLQFCGLWHFGTKTTQWPISILISILSTFISFCIGRFCLRYSSNIPVLTSALSSVVSFWTMILKIICYLTHRKVLKSLHETLEDEFMINLKKTELRPYLLKRMMMFSKVSIVMASGNGLVFLMFTYMTLRRIFVEKKYILLYPAIYPISFEPGKSIYWALLIFEIVLCFYLSCVTTAVDVGFIYYVFHICGHLNAIGFQFQNLKSDENYDAELKKCVKAHQMILKNKNRLIDIYGLIVGWVGITGALVLCSLVFQTSQIKQLTIQLAIKLGTYLWAKLWQVFSFAWFGTLMTADSEKTLNAIYECGWTNLTNKRMKIDMLIIMTQKPMALKIKQFFTISLTMFTMVMNTTVSYFFLLQTLDDNKD